MYIDGDGVPYWLMEQAIHDVRARWADVHVRAYKDWTNPGNNRLMVSLWDLGIDLVQVTPHAGLSNGTDIAIAIDAVDALHRDPTAPAVALVSNDGDFTSLAHHLRRNGVEVLGYGARDASTSLARACDHFVRFNPTTKLPMEEPTASEQSIEELVAEVISACADRDGWAPLDRFGCAIGARHGLRAKDVGARSWSTYFAASRRFECSRAANGLTKVRHRPREVQVA